MNMNATAISKMLPSIAMVEEVPRFGEKVGENLRGTAFAIDNRGYLLTANHVVRDLQPQNIEIRFTRKGDGSQTYGMSPHVVQAVYPHPVVDVAVLALKGTIQNRVHLPNSQEWADVGQQIALVGYALGTDLVFCDDISGVGSPKSYSPVAFRGMVAARIPDDGRNVDLYAYDCTTFAGNSGAPVIDEASCQILAVHLRGYDNHVGYGLPLRRVQSFSDEVIRLHEARRHRYLRKARNR